VAGSSSQFRGPDWTLFHFLNDRQSSTVPTGGQSSKGDSMNWNNNSFLAAFLREDVMALLNPCKSPSLTFDGTA